MAMIKTENLTYTYSPGTPFEKVAINNINLEIEEGEMVGVIGHTGSGKSTLIQHFNGLVKPTSGKIYIDGKEVSRTIENKSTYTKLDKVILSGTDPNAPQIPDGYYPYPGTTTPDVPAPVPVPGPSNSDSEMPEWLRPQTTAASTPDWLS